jgi:hypothetical protein
MANLAAYQKIDRVITGLPFGDGADGSATVSSDPNTRATITGTATQTTGTAGSTAFANGDLVILHQTQGTGVGQWEVNKVASGGGSTSLTFQVAHNFTYATGAQIIKIPRYTTATVSAHSVTAWNGTTGGVEVIVGKTSITVSGSPSASSKGFRGGVASGGNGQKPSGEGTVGTYANQYTPNGNGGGGPLINGSITSGGGGGHAAAGGNGSTVSGSGTLGQGGSQVGSADLVTMQMGGGGGGAGRDIGGSLSDGAIGAGILILISKDISQSAGAKADGGSSGNATDASGGAGAGGSILYVCDTATLGSGLSTTAAGTAGTATSPGGTASVGRIAIHHKGTVTGTSTPTFTDVTDTSLVEIIPVVLTGSYSYFM